MPFLSWDWDFDNLSDLVYLSCRLEEELYIEERFLPLKIFLVFFYVLFSMLSSKTRSWHVYSQFPIFAI